MTIKYYTGVGSRELPRYILRFLTDVAEVMAKKGYILRSGAAEGADTAFEKGCDSVSGAKEIWLPWNGFQGNYVEGDDYRGKEYHVPDPLSFLIASSCLKRKVIPYFHKMKIGAQKLHGRNYYQVYGYGEYTSRVCLYACPEDKHGEPTGGTRTAVKLAQSEGIPCYNLMYADQRKEVCEIIKMKWRDYYE